MPAHQASRTLVKSSPELWAECSDAASLARHLGQSHEIRITKLEPETAVAWEGSAARGTVRLEPAGWGTRVTLTLDPAETDHAPEPGGASETAQGVEVAPPAEPPAAEPSAPADAQSPRAFGRLRSLFRRRPATTAEPVPAAEPPAPEPPSRPARRRRSRPDLDAALDSLGSAHHRPYSRA
jgi:hypothetical protein